MLNFMKVAKSHLDLIWECMVKKLQDAKFSKNHV